MNTKQIAAVKKTAESVGGKVSKDYSGRGMFGKTCYGINCDNPTACIEVASANGLRGARWDQMGKGFIVYWPNIS